MNKKNKKCDYCGNLTQTEEYFTNSQICTTCLIKEEEKIDAAFDEDYERTNYEVEFLD